MQRVPLLLLSLFHLCTSSSVILGKALQSKAIYLCAGGTPPGSSLFLTCLKKSCGTHRSNWLFQLSPIASGACRAFFSAPTILNFFTYLSNHSQFWIAYNTSFRWVITTLSVTIGTTAYSYQDFLRGLQQLPPFKQTRKGKEQWYDYSLHNKQSTPAVWPLSRVL